MNDIEKIIDYNFEGQRLLFKNSKRIDDERFTIMYLDEFDDDYLNIAINLKSKNAEEFEKDFYKIKEIMNSKNRKTSIIINHNHLLKIVDYRAKGLKISDDSVWLMIENFKNFPKYKSDIPIVISKITKQEEKDYPYIVNNGFTKNSEQDPYDGLSESVIQAIKNSCYINGQFITEHYVAKYNNKIVGTMTIMYEKNIAYIYNVTTNIDYRKNGICKKLMSHILERLMELGINKAVLQTEKGFYPEKIYKSLGFKEILRAVKYTEK